MTRICDHGVDECDCTVCTPDHSLSESELLRETLRYAAGWLPSSFRARALALANRAPQPGDLIADCGCPCCGATLRVEVGDEKWEIGVAGTALNKNGGNNE